MNHSDLLRLKQRPGLHGAHCRACNYLFDAYDTPAPLNDVVMRLKTMRCPRCDSRENVDVVMPWKYVELVEVEIAADDRREAVRQLADKYISR